MIPSPVGLWQESPESGAAAVLTRLAPFKTEGGYWVFLPAATRTPVGHTRGAMTDAGAYTILDLTTTSGLRITRAPRGVVLIYA